MSDTPTYSFTLALEDFDPSLLPPEARTRGTPEFGAAVHHYLSEQFAAFGGSAQIAVDDRVVRVTWSASPTRPDPLELIVRKLEAGRRDEAVVLLELLRSQRPDDPGVLYNLGMALSDAGRLNKAEEHLRRLAALAPGFVNGRTALGVALVRAGRTAEAIEVLAEATRLDPDNSYALRNLGACLLNTGKPAEAEEKLRRASELSPADQQARYGLAQALHMGGKVEEADEVYIEVIRLNEHSQIAELARRARSQIGHKSFKEKALGDVRPDAVMYCLGALEKFEKMPASEVQKIGFEIAVLGMRGLDVNDPSQKYKLKSLPGAFSGLHLVCLMYVAFKQVAPQHDVGFDLSKEFDAAKALKSARDE